MADYDFDGYGGFPRYVSVAERRAKALKQARKLEKRGRKLEPVILTVQRIASSFWGKEWGKNLESYMDFSNRLPRGRTYLRSGAVVDLRIGKLARRRWGAVIKRCAGRIESVVGLLQGRLSEAVLEALVDRRAGLFPAPKEIDFTCSCPDSASLCKHIAAVLYGVGARLDKKPELFFTLRSVALEELVTKSALRRSAPAKEALDGGSLEGIFGIELDRGPRRQK